MNALEKIKLSKELAGWVADIKEGVYTPMAKIKAAKRINDIVKLLGGGQVTAKINEVRTALYSTGWSGIKNGSGEMVKSGFSAFLIKNQDGSDFYISIQHADGEGTSEIGDGVLETVDALVSAVNAVVQDNSKEPEQPASNPLYQSVIDGAPITTDLIKQLIEEGKKDPSNAQLKQAVAIVRDKVRPDAVIA